MRQYISFGPQAGIANRIKRLFTGLRLKAIQNEEIEMYWSLSELVTESFWDLFEFDTEFTLKQIIVDKKVILDDVMDIGENNVFRLLVPDIKLPEGFTKAYAKDEPDMEYIDFEYERIPSNVRKLYLPYFSKLKPSDKVSQRIQKINLPNNYISVHVRLNAQWKQFDRGKDNDLKKYEEAMKRYPSDTVFFLASCDAAVAEYFKERFKERIIELPDKDYIGSIDAVADLYLLSKGKEMIGSYGSTFTEMAWWLSGCLQKVMIIGEWKDWEKNKTHFSKRDIVKDTWLYKCIKRIFSGLQ